jgi:hypothetical protein
MSGKRASKNISFFCLTKGLSNIILTIPQMVEAGKGNVYNNFQK